MEKENVEAYNGCLKNVRKNEDYKFYNTIYYIQASFFLSLRINWFNRLKTKRRLLYLKAQSVPRCKHFSFRL
jgi:hypothetical protein